MLNGASRSGAAVTTAATRSVGSRKKPIAVMAGSGENAGEAGVTFGVVVVPRSQQTARGGLNSTTVDPI
jgi:hypothetical protein